MNFCSPKETIKWEKIFATDIPSKGFVLRILNSRKDLHFSSKMGKRFQRHFMKDEIQMTRI